MIYLVCPYSHSNPEVREARFQAVSRYAAKLMKEGKLVFSPVSHGHPIASNGDIDHGWDQWGELDKKILYLCNQMIVLQLPGWRESKGVSAEIKIALNSGVAVRFIEPDESILDKNAEYS